MIDNLESERLILEPISLKHVSTAYLSWLNDEDTIKYLVTKKGNTLKSLSNYIERHLEKNRIVILAAGTGNPFFTTDSAASLRAIEIGAEVLLKATMVDGVYDSDPKNNNKAKLYKHISFDKILSNKLNVMDATAIVTCRDNDLSLRVFNLLKPNTLVAAMTDASVGTSVGT